MNVNMSLIMYSVRWESSADPDGVGLGDPDPLEITKL